MNDSSPVASELYPLVGFHEPFSSMSHLLGAAIFAFLGYGLLLRGRGDRARLIYLSVYALACVTLFSLSGVYHMMARGGTARLVLGRLDHCAIFVLIAATFTPAHGLLFRGRLRWGPLLGIWGCAVVGVCLKSLYYDQLTEWLGLTMYLTMGWLGIFSGSLIARRHGFKFVAPLLWGGIAYSIGAVLEFLRWTVIIPGVVHPHEVFHLAVLAGAALHWYWIWAFADGAAIQIDQLEPCLNDECPMTNDERMTNDEARIARE
jgi:channel protein (hemolysin III family)